MTHLLLTCSGEVCSLVGRGEICMFRLQPNFWKSKGTRRPEKWACCFVCASPQENRSCRGNPYGPKQPVCVYVRLASGWAFGLGTK